MGRFFRGGKAISCESETVEFGHPGHYPAPPELKVTRFQRRYFQTVILDPREFNFGTQDAIFLNDFHQSKTKGWLCRLYEKGRGQKGLGLQAEKIVFQGKRGPAALNSKFLSNASL